MKILSVVGNRPQFIKSAPLSVALRDAGIDEVVLHTGQHYDPELSQVFFEELELREPGYALGLRTADPEPMQAGILEAIERERPDWVLVYGDTNSTAAGGRAAAETQTPLAHVEAGLRSGDLSMPEERNRIEVDRLAQLLLAPSEHAAATLEREGVSGRAEVVGDVMHDATQTFWPIALKRSDVLERLGVEAGQYVVLTIHREANTQPERLREIVAALNRVRRRMVFPVHPRTARVIAEEQLELAPEIELIDPLGYFDFVALASQAGVILTDSGGLQKEAYWYGVPCLTLRPSTEWVETVEVGANQLVEPSGLGPALEHARMPGERPQLYGDGRASERIAGLLVTLTP
ncbi:MAG: UDP-N-acetylglucosamine 2-epimerase (non-hydrolyzing) [Actinomycetota bacterium]|nr:UDP-N-acetylglucosamine 2-epimerase (non-hydrolyzing) [Actinomycetota bacterium]